jgi:hypothetical protein
MAAGIDQVQSGDASNANAMLKFTHLTCFSSTQSEGYASKSKLLVYKTEAAWSALEQSHSMPSDTVPVHAYQDIYSAVCTRNWRICCNVSQTRSSVNPIHRPSDSAIHICSWSESCAHVCIDVASHGCFVCFPG